MINFFAILGIQSILESNCNNSTHHHSESVTKNLEADKSEPEGSIEEPSEVFSFLFEEKCFLQKYFHTFLPLIWM